MKTISPIATLILLFSASIFGQSVTIKDVKANQSGPMVIDGKLAGFYALKEKQKGKDDIFELRFFNEALQETNHFETEMPGGTEQVSGAFNGSHYLLVFFNANKQFLQYITVTASGQLVKKRSIDKIGHWPDGGESVFLQVFSAGTDGFYLIQPVKDDKTGYRVERVNNDLSPVWKKSFVPEKGVSIFYSGAVSEGDLVFIGLNQRPALQKRKYHFELIALDGKTGKKQFEKPLYTDDRLLFPTGQILVDQHRIAFSGMYFKGDKIKDSNSDGVFVSVYKRSGAPLREGLHPWESMKDYFKPYKKFLAKKPKVMVHSLAAQGGDFIVVGEMFQHSADADAGSLKRVGVAKDDKWRDGDSDGKFTLLDFVAFRLDTAALQMQDVAFCHKDPKVIRQTDYKMLDIENNDFALALQAAGKSSAMRSDEDGGSEFSFISLDKTAAGDPLIYFLNEREEGLINIYLGAAAFKNGEFRVKKYDFENILGGVIGLKPLTYYMPLSGGKVLKNTANNRQKTWELTIQ